MTHRVFWLTVGAGLGISGYRRANRLVRGLTRQVPHRPRLSLPGRKDALRPKLAGVAEFARDVRDGMDLYQEQQRLNIERRRAAGGRLSGEGSTEGHTLDVHRGSEAEGGRDGSRGAHGAPRAHG